MNKQSTPDMSDYSPIEANLPRLDIMGVNVVDLTEEDALRLIHDNIEAGQHTKIGFLNANNSNLAHKNYDFKNAINKFVLFSDGVGVDIAARALHGRKFKDNLNGTDLIPAILKSARRPLKVALYGAKPGVAIKTVSTFKAMAPEHEVRVVGHGYINETEQAAMLNELKIWKPDIFLVATGVPRQELFMAQHVTADHCTLAFGIGALFDLITGNVPRAPALLRTWRLEWAYRLYKEPRRLAGRYILGNPLFLYNLAKYKFGRKQST